MHLNFKLFYYNNMLIYNLKFNDLEELIEHKFKITCVYKDVFKEGPGG